jgi:hypothetical protein
MDKVKLVATRLGAVAALLVLVAHPLSYWRW